MTKFKEWPDAELTFFAEEPPASHSASPDSERDWLTRVATSCSPILPLLHAIAPVAGLGERPRRPVSNGGRDFGTFLGGWGTRVWVRLPSS
jgi:hypothetical protein